MWKIKRYKVKAGTAIKTIITYNGIPVDRVCSYEFGTELQLADSGEGQVPVDILKLKIQMPDVEFEEEMVESLIELESKYSREEIGPTKEDRSFSVELLKKSYAAERKKLDEALKND